MLDSRNLDYGYDRFYVLRRIITSWLCVLIGINCPHCLRQNKTISQDILTATTGFYQKSPNCTYSKRKIDANVHRPDSKTFAYVYPLLKTHKDYAVPLESINPMDLKPRIITAGVNTPTSRFEILINELLSTARVNYCQEEYTKDTLMYLHDLDLVHRQFFPLRGNSQTQFYFILARRAQKPQNPSALVQMCAYVRPMCKCAPMCGLCAPMCNFIAF